MKADSSKRPLRLIGRDNKELKRVVIPQARPLTSDDTGEVNAELIHLSDGLRQIFHDSLDLPRWWETLEETETGKVYSFKRPDVEHDEENRGEGEDGDEPHEFRDK